MDNDWTPRVIKGSTWKLKIQRNNYLKKSLKKIKKKKQNPDSGFRIWIERGKGRRSRDPSLRVSQLGGHADGDRDRDRRGRGREGDRDRATEREGKGRVGISAPLLQILDLLRSLSTEI